jgi:hypothetical protein
MGYTIIGKTCLECYGSEERSMKIKEIREVPHYLRQRTRMPVARFELLSSLDPELCSVALNDVVLLDPEDTMEEVKDRAAQLARYRDKGLLTIRYDICISDPDLWNLYEDSNLFNELWVLSQQGRGREDFLFDHARVRMGLITLTPKGQELFLSGPEEKSF